MENLNLEEVNQKIFKFKENLEQKLLAEYKEKQENTSENNQQEEIKLTEIFSVQYYDQLSLKTKIKDLLITVRDVYIVELVNGDSTTYEIYLKDINHKIEILQSQVEFIIKKPVDREYLYYTIKNITIIKK